MRVLLTGASGLLGRQVHRLLMEREHVVTALSRSRRLDDRTVLLDLGNRAELQELPGDFDCIVHLAASLPVPGQRIEPEEWFRRNTEATLNLLEFCASRGVRSFVYGSSWYVYGRDRDHYQFSEDNEARPTDAYSLSKLGGEILTHPYHFFYGISVKILRFSYLFGNGMRADTVVQKFLSRAMRNQDIPLSNGGEDCTDLLYAKDAAAAVEAAMLRGNGVYNIGSGVSCSIKQLAEAVISATGSSSKTRSEPDLRPPQKLYLSIEKASRELHWAPGYTLPSALRDCVLERSQTPAGSSTDAPA